MVATQIRRRLAALTLLCAAALVPSVAHAEQTLKPVTVHGRVAKPSVVIIVPRQTPNLRPAPISPPKSFTESK